MLEELRKESIAAYVTTVEPAQKASGNSSTESADPSMPVDRLWVDAAAERRAQAVVEDRLSQLPARQEPSTAEPADAERPGNGTAKTSEPAQADKTEEAAEPQEADKPDDANEPQKVDEQADRTTRPAGEAMSEVGTSVEAGALGEEGLDDHYIPPTPPPLPTASQIATGAWIALLGGPLSLLLATLLGWQTSGLFTILALTASAGGFLTLVVRMKGRSTTDSDPDHGAVV